MRTDIQNKAEKYKWLRQDIWRTHIYMPPQPWREHQLRGVSVWQAGVLEEAERIAASIVNLDTTRLARLLRAEHGQFGLIVESTKHVVAIADRITGYPIFYRRSGRLTELSTDSSVWLTSEMSGEIDEAQVKLFLMAGYPIGRKTLLSSVARLLPGEFIVIDKASGAVTRQRYYSFEPTFQGEGDEAHWRNELEQALDAAFMRFIEQTDGRRIWLGLSAGYDSRLLLGKLLQHGARDIQTFSYGTPGNMEARVARDLAASVDVPWRFVRTRGRANREDFRSGACARYLLRGGGINATAAVTEFFALQTLIEKGDLTGDDVVTNGQTGDFLSGGHIPKDVEFSYDAVDCYIRQKHLSLFNDMGDGHESNSVLAEWRASHLSGGARQGPEAVISAYQSFEWQERQARFVVNQHRAHDFLGLTWRLPLWDGDLMDVFQKAPLALQQRQKLYLGYLKSWNYRNLFDQMRLPYDPWPRGGFLIKGLARLAGLTKGDEAKAAVYDNLSYFGEYHYLYRLFGRPAFLAFQPVIRSPASLFALDQLVRIRRALDMAPVGAHERAYDDLMKPALADAPLSAAA